MIIQDSVKNTTIRIEIITDQDSIEKCGHIKKSLVVLADVIITVLMLNLSVRRFIVESFTNLIDKFHEGVNQFKETNHMMKGRCDCNGCG